MNSINARFASNAPLLKKIFQGIIANRNVPSKINLIRFIKPVSFKIRKKNITFSIPESTERSLTDNIFRPKRNIGRVVK